MEKISAPQAAKLLGISVDKLGILEKQGLIHSTPNKEGESFYSSGEIAEIKSRHGPTLADEAALVGTQIQQEVFTSVSSLVALRKRVSILGVVVFSGLVLLFITLSILFYIYPLQMSDFFGFYYRYNIAKQKISLSNEKDGNVLAAAIGPVLPTQTSVLADLIKPVAAVSLVAVKAVDNQKYTQIVTNPVDAAGFGGLVGSPGSAGANGINGADGQTGPAGVQGLQGVAGSAGANGASGSNGTNGANGTSVADVLTTTGSIIIRDGTNTTVSLGPGSNGQVLTISGGIPAWGNSSGGAFSNLSSGTNTTAAMLIGTGASLGPIGSGTVTANSFSGANLTTSNFTSANISQWTNNSGYITASSTDTLTNKTIAAGSNTISGLTASNLTAGNYSTAITSGTYGINISGNAATVTTNANLTGPITSVGNATSVASQTGTGSTFVMNTSPTLVTPVLGVATATSITGVGGLSIVGGSTSGNNLTLSSTSNATKGKILFGTSGYDEVNNRLGIRTVFPNTDIQIGPLSNTNTNAVLIGGVAGAGYMINTTGTNYAMMYTNGDNILNFGFNTTIAPPATPVLTLLQTGFAGFGNSTPSKTVDISGTLRSTGATDLATAGASNVTIATTGTGTVAIGNSTGTFSLTSSGGLNVTTDGALTGVASLDTISASATGLTFAGAGTIASTTTSALTLDSGTTGNVNLGIGSSAKNISIGGIGANTITIGNTQTAGSVSIGGAMTTGAITIGNTSGAQTGAITIDGGTGTQTITIGNGAGNKTVTLGSTNTTSTLNLNSGSGNVNFTVDGTGSSGKVQIGSSGTATPDLLVLDNGTADPAGVNGGMYYNTTSGKFRCYENSAWNDCISTGGGSGTGYTLVEKTADESTNTDTTLSNDTDLKFSASANTAYVVEFIIRYHSTSATPDFKYTVTGPTGAIFRGIGIAYDGTSDTGNVNIDACNIESITTVCQIIGTQAPDFLIKITGIMEVQGTAGTVAFQWAQNNSNATNTTVDQDSILRYLTLSGTSGADLAELYSTNDAKIEEGDVVSLDPSLQAGVKKSQKAYDQSVMGIISTKPGLVIGSVDKEGVKAVLVALSGRVPVKVSAENGPIKAGDYLTTSSTSGVAMKATKAGAIIGTAMSPFNGEGIGQVLVFVKNGSSMGSSLDDGSDGKDILMQLLSGGAIGEKAVASNSAEPAKTGSALETNLVGYISKIVTDLFKNTVEFFGSVIFHGDVTFLGRPTFNKDTAGHALIKQGESEVSINFKKEYTSQPVVNASINMIGAVKLDEVPGFAVYDLSTKGFKIKLSKATTFDLSFSWVALGVNGDNVSTNGVSSTPLLSPVPTVIPSATHSPSPEIVPSQTAVQSASPSAEPLP